MNSLGETRRGSPAPSTVPSPSLKIFEMRMAQSAQNIGFCWNLKAKILQISTQYLYKYNFLTEPSTYLFSSFDNQHSSSTILHLFLIFVDLNIYYIFFEKK